MAVLNCKCIECGTMFHTKPSHIAKGEGKYCSRKCFSEAKKKYMKGAGNHQYGLKGNKNSSFNGERIKHHDYVYLYVPDHPFADKHGRVREHRYVAEKHFLNDENSILIDGKNYLDPKYEVHHINMIKDDNRPENLMVLTKSEHKRLHTQYETRNRNSLGRFKGK